MMGGDFPSMAFLSLFLLLTVKNQLNLPATQLLIILLRQGIYIVKQIHYLFLRFVCTDWNCIQPDTTDTGEGQKFCDVVSWWIFAGALWAGGRRKRRQIVCAIRERRRWTINRTLLTSANPISSITGGVEKKIEGESQSVRWMKKGPTMGPTYLPNPPGSISPQ